jgi:hypothetical protein
VSDLVRKLQIYFYSPSNVWGSLAGFAGLALLFTGVIDRGWLLIVAGLYCAGALAAPRPRPPRIQIDESLSPEELRSRLDQLIASVAPSTDKGTVAALESIRDQALELLPKIDAASADADSFHLRETVYRYLPQSVEAYLKLPRLYRQHQVVRDGKTAERLFSEQVVLLQREVNEVGSRIYQADAQSLLAQGRFLDDKFRRSGGFEVTPLDRS